MARQLGANHYLGKPYSDEELLGLIQHYSLQGGSISGGPLAPQSLQAQTGGQRAPGRRGLKAGGLNKKEQHPLLFFYSSRFFSRPA